MSNIQKFTHEVDELPLVVFVRCAEPELTVVVRAPRCEHVVACYDGGEARTSGNTCERWA